MWPFTRQSKPEPDRDVVERLDDLEDTSRHLERRFVRLQQQFSRMVREMDTEEDPVGDEEEDTQDEVLREILKSRRQS